jgi:hypothetical protein
MNLVVFYIRNQEMDSIHYGDTKRVPEVIIVKAHVRQRDHRAIDAHEALHLMIKRVIDPTIVETPLGVHPMENNRGEQPVGPLHERRVL